MERRPARETASVPGLYNAWIWLDNPSQYNSYTTEMVKAVILAFRAASNARDVNCVVFTGVGDKAFCTGGNTKEYAEYYAGRPQEYRQYMRLFNDMVSAILACDKPVICRVNGMRIGGGGDRHGVRLLGGAGPGALRPGWAKHGSAPIGGATDFLPVVIGAERPWRRACCASRSRRTRPTTWACSPTLPALKVDGKFVRTRWSRRSASTTTSKLIFGKSKTGEALKQAKEP